MFSKLLALFTNSGDPIAKVHGLKSILIDLVQKFLAEKANGDSNREAAIDALIALLQAEKLLLSVPKAGPINSSTPVVKVQVPQNISVAQIIPKENP